MRDLEVRCAKGFRVGKMLKTHILPRNIEEGYDGNGVEDHASVALESGVRACQEKRRETRRPGLSA